MLKYEGISFLRELSEVLDFFGDVVCFISQALSQSLAQAQKKFSSLFSSTASIQQYYSTAKLPGSQSVLITGC